MTSLTLPLHDALYDRVAAAITASGITAALTTRPVPNQALPYVVIVEDDEQLSSLFTCKAADANTMTHTVRVFAASQTDAKTIRAAIIANLTGAAIDLGSTGYVIDIQLESAPLVPEPRPDGTHYHIPIRFRLEGAPSA